LDFNFAGSHYEQHNSPGCDAVYTAHFTAVTVNSTIFSECEAVTQTTRCYIPEDSTVQEEYMFLYDEVDSFN
jgi:hypothetical protein